MCKTETCSLKLLITGIFLLTIVSIIKVEGQDTLFLISPGYDVTDRNWEELMKVSDGMIEKLKTKFMDLSYTCITENFQDWNIYNDQEKADKVKLAGSKYVISTETIKKINSNKPSEAGFEINFIIEHLNSNGNLVKLNWYHSQYIIINISLDKNIEIVAAKVSEDFHFFRTTGQFRPRFKILEFDSDPVIEDVDTAAFANWLGDLLKKRIYLYVIYYNDKIYPAACNNVLTGKFSDKSLSSTDMINVLIEIHAADESEKCRKFVVHKDPDIFLDSEASISELIQEIENSINKLKDYY